MHFLHKNPLSKGAHESSEKILNREEKEVSHIFYEVMNKVFKISLAAGDMTFYKMSLSRLEE